jgi:hypothetical protein
LIEEPIKPQQHLVIVVAVGLAEVAEFDEAFDFGISQV